MMNLSELRLTGYFSDVFKLLMSNGANILHR